MSAIIDALQIIIDFLSHIMSSFLDLFKYVGEATVLLVELGANLPAPIAMMLTSWGVIMIVYSIKGS